MDNSDSKRLIDATRTSFQVIEQIRRCDGATLSELSNALDLAKSTVHAHLSTLQELGYVIREGDTYHVALKFLHFGEYARNRNPRYPKAQDAVHELSELTNEEVDFTVEENGRLVSLYHSVGQSDESGMQVGSLFYMHNTAAGKAILAEWSQEQVEAIVHKWGLPADTEDTITDLQTLRQELDQIREDGYAVNDEEILPGFRSIGATVHTSDGNIIGALSIGGPTYRLSADEATLQHLFDSVERLEDILESDSQNMTDWWGQYHSTRK